MSSRVGIHFGHRSVSIAMLGRRGILTDAWEIEAPAGEVRWRYSEEQVDAVVEQIERRLPMSRAVVCAALPAKAVFFRRLDEPHGADQEDEGKRPRRLDDESVRYAAEPLLPWPLDELHIVPVGAPVPQSAVMAVPRKPWSSLLDRLDHAGWVCSTAVCDIHALMLGVLKDREDGRPCAVIGIGPTDSAVAIGGGGRILQARPLMLSHGDQSSCGDSVIRELHRTWWPAVGAGAPPRGVAIIDGNVDDGDFRSLEKVEIIRVADVLSNAPLQSLGVLYAQAAARCIQVPVDGCRNLRAGAWRSAVIRRRFAAATVAHSAAAGLVCLAVAGGLFHHGQRLSARTAGYRSTGNTVWASLFPDSAPPIDVESRLISEHERERGLRSGGGEAPRYVPALDLLRDVVTAMPADVPVRVHRIDATGDLSVMVGEARSHGEVERITGQLATVSSLAVQPASTERTAEGTVRFTIRFEKQEQRGG